MLIGVDVSRANKTHRTGVEWYAYHVASELARMPEAAHHEWLAYTPSALLPDLRTAIPSWTERRLTWPPKYLWTQARLSYEMYTLPPELLFVPAHVLPRIVPKRTFVTVHDVGFHRFPQLYKPIQVAYHEISTRDIAHSDAHVLTVSEFSKQEIMEAYGIAADRITVTPLGIDPIHAPQSLVNQQRVREKFGLGDDPFVMFVGRLEEKKNVRRLVEAFLTLAEERSDVLCVLGGLPGRNWSSIQGMVDRHPQGTRVRVTGYLSEEDKCALLSAASCYVQPSFYEGFGLPILEAMACGTVVVSSSAGALPEVGGDAVFSYVDPRSVDELTLSMKRSLDLALTERDAWIQRGRERSACYTWQETARQTLAAFERYV